MSKVARLNYTFEKKLLTLNWPNRRVLDPALWQMNRYFCGGHFLTVFPILKHSCYKAIPRQVGLQIFKKSSVTVPVLVSIYSCYAGKTNWGLVEGKNHLLCTVPAAMLMWTVCTWSWGSEPGLWATHIVVEAVVLPEEWKLARGSRKSFSLSL